MGKRSIDGAWAPQKSSIVKDNMYVPNALSSSSSSSSEFLFFSCHYFVVVVDTAEFLRSSLLVVAHGRARADQVAVTVAVINAGDSREELELMEVGQGVGGLETAVGLCLPEVIILHQDGQGVGGIVEDVVLLGLLAVLDILDLSADGNHGVAEAVEFLLALRLSGFDHEGVRNGPRHGGRVEAVILETLGNVDSLDTDRAEGTDVDDELVGAHAVLVGEQDLVVLTEAVSHVVGVQESNLGGVLDTLTTHHLDVGPGDGEDRGRAVGGGRDGSDSLVTSGRKDGMAGKVRSQVRLDTDGAHTGSTTSVGDTEGLVQVQVADISTNVAGRGQTDLGVHVGSVHVDLASVGVNDLAGIRDSVLKDTEGRGVGDHEGREAVRVLGGLSLQVSKVQVSVGQALDGNDLHTGHGSRGGVGSVGRDGDQADVTLGVTTALVVGTNGTETGILSLGTRVGLERDIIETGDLGQVATELLEHDLVTLGLVIGGEGMDVAELGPGDRDHLGGGVQLHGAGTERDHRVGEREILVLEAVDVTEHLGLGVVRVEDLVGQVLGGTDEALIEDLGGARLGDVQLVGDAEEVGGRGTIAGENLDELLQLGLVDGLVKGDTDGLGIKLADVDTGSEGLLDEGISTTLDLDGQGVKEALVLDLVTSLLDSLGKDDGHVVDALGDLLDTSRSVVDGIEGSHVGEEGLGSADVGGGLLTTNVLLTGLEGKTVGRVTLGVLGDTDETTGHSALVLVLAGKEGGVGTTIAEWDTEALRVSEGNIGTPLTRGSEHGQGHEIGGSDNLTAISVDLVGKTLVVGDVTTGIGVLLDGGREIGRER